ncbi:MAG: DUF5615 family PIN-like protein [Calditrichota bacterium]
MKLLFDHNLSYKLCEKLSDIFPNSMQVRMLELQIATDLEIWTFARDNNYTIVTQDADFYDLSLLHEHPPKTIWLRCGNQPTKAIEHILRKHYSNIVDFISDPAIACLEIY